MDDLLNKITNISMADGKTISLTKIVMLFYMLIGANFMTHLVSKQMKKFVQDNRLVQHIIGIISMVVLITTFGIISDVKLALLYSFIAYLFFILTTKMDLHINLIIVLLLVIAYLYETNIDIDIEKKNKVLTAEEKLKLIEKDTQYKKSMVIIIFLVTVVGTVMYNNKKNIQYGGGFSLYKYLLY
uniref:Uncharacterized protein n=1 Tax=viral metagenome TaxID=1070528 RepID=A0A6C0ECR3_9ZZZZ